MPSPSPTPIPVTIVSDLPDWLTLIAVPAGSALLAAGIVFFGLYLERRKRNQTRRAVFIDELAQVLIESAKIAQADDEDVLIRDGMQSNVHRVRAVAQMKRKEHPVYKYANDLAVKVAAGVVPKPQKATAAAIEQLLSWLVGDKKTSDFKKGADTTPVS